MTFYAFPQYDSPGNVWHGADRPGTMGVMSGEYKSVRNFIRHNVSKNAQTGVTYSIRLKNDQRDWPLLATYTRENAR